MLSAHLNGLERMNASMEEEGNYYTEWIFINLLSDFHSSPFGALHYWLKTYLLGHVSETLSRQPATNAG